MGGPGLGAWGRGGGAEGAAVPGGAGGGAGGPRAAAARAAGGLARMEGGSAGVREFCASQEGQRGGAGGRPLRPELSASGRRLRWADEPSAGAGSHLTTVYLITPRGIEEQLYLHPAEAPPPEARPDGFLRSALSSIGLGRVACASGICRPCGPRMSPLEALAAQQR